jgi:hypothetical protein
MRQELAHIVKSPGQVIGLLMGQGFNNPINRDIKNYPGTNISIIGQPFRR